jgi:hypothetical protein
MESTSISLADFQYFFENYGPNTILKVNKYGGLSVAKTNGMNGWSCCGGSAWYSGKNESMIKTFSVTLRGAYGEDCGKDAFDFCYNYFRLTPNISKNDTRLPLKVMKSYYDLVSAGEQMPADMYLFLPPQSKYKVIKPLGNQELLISCTARQEQMMYKTFKTKTHIVELGGFEIYRGIDRKNILLIDKTGAFYVCNDGACKLNDNSLRQVNDDILTKLKTMVVYAYGVDVCNKFCVKFCEEILLKKYLSVGLLFDLLDLLFKGTIMTHDLMKMQISDFRIPNMFTKDELLAPSKDQLTPKILYEIINEIQLKDINIKNLHKFNQLSGYRRLVNGRRSILLLK